MGAGQDCRSEKLPFGEKTYVLGFLLLAMSLMTSAPPAGHDFLRLSRGLPPALKISLGPPARRATWVYR